SGRSLLNKGLKVFPQVTAESIKPILCHLANREHKTRVLDKKVFIRGWFLIQVDEEWSMHTF
ncbi:MAG: hypothetical protein QXI11_08675, partial [Thermoproteota archaeon]